VYFRWRALEAALSTFNLRPFFKKKKIVSEGVNEINEVTVGAGPSGHLNCLSWKDVFGSSADRDVTNRTYIIIIIIIIRY
jgi:hypothetical protein